jgi:hypothetical protein
MTGSQWARSRRRAAIRLAACLLLVAIGADLAADARCDAASPLAGSSSVRTGEQPPGSSGDACAPVCVPDCFCCSRSLAAAPLIVPPAPVALSSLDVPAKERWPEGVRRVLDHPPLRLV